MTIGERHDGSELDAMVAGLPVHDALPERVERVRERCLTALSGRRGRAEPRSAAVTPGRARLQAAFAGGLSALYLAGVVERALEILR